MDRIDDAVSKTLKLKFELDCMKIQLHPADTMILLLKSLRAWHHLLLKPLHYLKM